ncbi:uncharacterized protein UDID_18753 [Ustilago sp. UG-2017a]|nr:uncharacterized protein UDID_18753 [Ustilago sp. UG-2017a]
MVRGNELSPMQRASITAVHKTIQNFKEHGSFETKAQYSCLHTWTATLDRYLQCEVLKNPFISWQELSALLGGVPTTQLRKAAYRAGINRRIKRLDWAKANGSTDWKHALFMDEAAVKVGYRPGHTWVSRQKSTREDINNIVLTFRSSRFRTHIWAGIAYNLKPFVEDGSSCYQAAICKQQRAEYNIQMQEHLPASPDLNPIENIWYVFKNLLGKRLPVPKPRDELARAAEEVWNTQITLSSDHLRRRTGPEGGEIMRKNRKIGRLRSSDKARRDR